MKSSEDIPTDDRVIAYNTATGKMGLVERQPRSFAAVVSDGAGRFKLAGEATARLVPKSEYDFQQANARLQKEDLSASGIIGPKTTFYDKSNSFFDNISCEATRIKEEKLDRNERSWNIETFGIPAPSGQHHHYHNRGYHHHRGGYHHHRGGARRGGYSGGNKSGFSAGTSSFNGSYGGHHDHRIQSGARSRAHVAYEPR